jgi:hypothetical protein
MNRPFISETVDIGEATPYPGDKDSPYQMVHLRNSVGNRSDSKSMTTPAYVKKTSLMVLPD